MRRSDTSRHRAGAVVVLSGVCGVLAASVAQAEVRFVPRIGFNAVWVDNSQLAASGESKESELIGQATPGIRLIVDADRLQAFLDYQLQAIHFQADSGSTEVFHQVELGTQWEALQDWLYLDLSGSRSQTVVDPAGPVNVDNMFSVGNLANATSGQVTPMIQHKFRVAEMELAYTRGFLKYDKADGPDAQEFNLDDSKNESASAALRSTNVDAFLSWEATYRHDKVDYDLAETFQYDQALATLGFRITPALRLLGRGGKESDPRLDVSKGGLDATFWQGGFEWSRGEKNTLRVLAGRRFFGNSYDASWRYTGRLLEFGATYQEMPTTQTQTHVIRGVTAPVDDFPTQIDRDFSRATADVYVLKRADAHVGMRGRITDVFVSVNSETREYLNLPGGLEDKYHGFDILASRRLTARMRLDATAGWNSSDLRDSDSFKDKQYALTLARQIGTSTDLTFAANRLTRTGGLRSYTVNWFEFGFAMSFGKADANPRGGRDRQQGPNRRMLPTVSGRP